MSASHDVWRGSFSLNGFDVHLSPIMEQWRYVGPVVLRSTCPVSDHFRDEFNTWAIALFGGTRDANILQAGQKLFMHPIVWQHLQREALKP